MKTKKNKLTCSILFALAAGALSACGGSKNDPAPDATGNTTGNTGGVITKQVNATAGGFGAQPDDPMNKYTYFNLATEAVVELTDDEAEASSDWHIAFKRTNFKLNGGVSGPAGIKGAVADSQDDFYDENGDPDNSVFLNASAENEQASLNAVTDVSTLSFKDDSNTPYIKGDGSDDGWWLYAGPPTHAVSANPDKWWLIKSSAGDSYAKFNVTDIVQVSRDISLDIFIQGATDSLFSTTAISWTAAIGEAGGSKCFDIDADAAVEVDCITAAADWDIKVEITDRDWNIWTNGGVAGEGSGGAFGSFDAAGAATYVSGSVGPGGDSLSRFYRPDSVGGLFKDDTWFSYSLEGNQKLWPNYRVYAIDTGAVQYKLQILSYYDDAGTSGMIKFRYESL
ncbi:hypothetical protein MNBD_GAMMA16-1202 [hydrothermal vent metagenome]|uniref:HmuY protein n=1 Tax=hydrothermal vent metagenome TaxID=652676 RepID=A0A3B0Z8A5_9ZZZZ